MISNSTVPMNDKIGKYENETIRNLIEEIRSSNKNNFLSNVIRYIFYFFFNQSMKK